jgi:hypothetical protein
MNYKEYHDFRPIEYLYQFYLNENKENTYCLNFLVDSANYIWKDWNLEKRTLIELGGGPSLFSVIPLSLIAKEIYFTDYLKYNLNIIQDWLNKKEHFLWDHFIEKTLYLEQQKFDHHDFYVSPRLVEHRKEVIRRRWKKNFELDLKSFSIEPQQYDLVSCHFVPECIVDNSNDFLFVLQNILSYSKENGFLLFSFFLEANHLKVGRSVYSTYYLTEEYLKRILEHFNLEVIKFQTIDSIFHYGYKKIALVLARNKQKNQSIAISRKSEYILNLVHLLNKKNKIIYKGFLNKYIWSYLNHTKIQNEFTNHIYDSLETGSIKIKLDKKNFYIDVEQVHKISSIANFFFEDQNPNFNFAYLKNKSYYLNLKLKEIQKKYNFISFKDGLFYLYLSSVEQLEKTEILKKLNYFIYNNCLHIPIVEFHSLIDFNNFLSTIEELSNKNFFIEQKPDFLKRSIDLKIVPHNEIILYKDYLIDFNYQRFSNKLIKQNQYLYLNTIQLLIE